MGNPMAEWYSKATEYALEHDGGMPETTPAWRERYLGIPFERKEKAMITRDTQCKMLGCNNGPVFDGICNYHKKVKAGLLLTGSDYEIPSNYAGRDRKVTSLLPNMSGHRAA